MAPIPSAPKPHEPPSNDERITRLERRVKGLRRSILRNRKKIDSERKRVDSLVKYQYLVMGFVACAGLLIGLLPSVLKAFK